MCYLQLHGRITLAVIVIIVPVRGMSRPYVGAINKYRLLQGFYKNSPLLLQFVAVSPSGQRIIYKRNKNVNSCVVILK